MCETRSAHVEQVKDPMTALRTFGKLLLRRLPPQDTLNRELAKDIILQVFLKTSSLNPNNHIRVYPVHNTNPDCSTRTCRRCFEAVSGRRLAPSEVTSACELAPSRHQFFPEFAASLVSVSQPPPLMFAYMADPPPLPPCPASD